MYTVFVGQTESMSPFAKALLAGLAVTCLILVGFDHRRGKGREDEIGLGRAAVTAALFSLGGLAWVEAAWRAGGVASLSGGFGIVAALGALVAWSPAMHRAWTQRQRAKA